MSKGLTPDNPNPLEFFKSDMSTHQTRPDASFEYSEYPDVIQWQIQ